MSQKTAAMVRTRRMRPTARIKQMIRNALTAIDVNERGGRERSR
jgi:hypothetical protein